MLISISSIFWCYLPLAALNWKVKRQNNLVNISIKVSLLGHRAECGRVTTESRKTSGKYLAQVNTSVGDYTNRWTSSAITSPSPPKIPCVTQVSDIPMSNSHPSTASYARDQILCMSLFTYIIILADRLFCKSYNFSKLSSVLSVLLPIQQVFH